jgi:CxxC motif-containing protein (DUF1111 family)
MALGCAVVLACDSLLTAPLDDNDLFDAPLPGLTAAEMAVFLRGDSEFGRRFAATDGLGPIFNNVSCLSCHPGDGRGAPENILTRFPGAVVETLPEGVDVSRRLPPPVFGMGLIGAIPAAAILANADSSDADGDGISGRPNWVVSPPWVPDSEPGGGPGLHIGRFSRKAQVSSVLQQVVAAYQQDMGITSEFVPIETFNPQTGGATLAADHVPDPEVDASTVRAVVDYVRMLAAPPPGEATAQRMRGEEVFGEIGCDKCHVPEFQTGPSPIGALANTPVRLYSDLLLHDMGDELADNRPDGGANGREWRTTPLWGLRLVPKFLNGNVFLMHDGRATTIEEAIGLHGGEAAGVRSAFQALGQNDKTALIDFVESR